MVLEKLEFRGLWRVVRFGRRIRKGKERKVKTVAIGGIEHFTINNCQPFTELTFSMHVPFD